MKTIEEQIKELDSKIESLDKLRFVNEHGRFTYDPKRNEEISRQMRELRQIKGGLLIELAKQKEEQ